MMLIVMLGVATGFAQVTTIVNYDFNSGTTYNTLTPVLAPGLACVVDGVATYSLATNGAVATGTNAFTPNTTAGNGLVMTNSSGTNTRYFEFQLSGGLSQFYAYKIYFQSQRGGAGASKITAAYSTDGVNYTNFPTTQAPGLGAPAECLYDLSSITSINLVPALYIRLLVSGATGTGAMGIDNFQMSATKCTTPANISAGANKVLTCANPSAVLTGSSTTSGVTYSWSPGSIATSSMTVTTAGTYTVKLTDPANGCSRTATTSVTTNTTAPGLGIAPVPTTSLTGYWPFNGNANDASGTANHGTVTGATLTTDRFGNPNKAYYFDGVSNKIDVANASTIDMVNGNDYCVSFWMKTDPGNGYALPVSKAPLGGGWNGYHFFVNCTDVGYCNGVGKFSFYTASGANGDACADNLISNDFNNWYFITGQYKGSTNQAFLYVNGVLQSDVGSASGTLSNTAPLRFGACACGPYQFYKGALDDIRFYKRLLSQAEINALYNEANPIPEIACGSPGLTLMGYSPTAGVTYSWSPGGITTSSMTVTTAGTYTVKVTDPVNACSSSATYTVQKELCVSANITNYQSEDVKGQASLIIDGGHAPYHIAWNNIKVPTGFVAYHQLIDSLPGLTIDSAQFMHDVDSIRQKTIFPDLSPGIYPVTVYDQSGDSVVLVLSVSNGANDWYHTSGVTSAVSAPPYRTVGDRKYYYGTGRSVTQSGTFTSGSCFAIPLAPMNFDGANELSFIVPSVTQIASVGLCERRDTLNGNTADLAANTMFRFNGNSTYDILFNNAVIFNGVLSANDQFMMLTNPATGKLSYYKNEQFLADANLLVIDKARGFIPKIVLGSVNASIRGILIKNPLTPKINLQISDLTCSTGNCGGSAYASAYYPIVNSPIRYELYAAGNPSPVQTISAVGVPGVTFTGLCQGNYNVVFHTNMVYFVFVPGGGIVQMTTPVSLQQSFSLNYSPAWTSQPNVSINPTDYSLTKSGGISGAWDAGTSSLNVLKQTASGWIEWTAQSSDAVNGIGFSTTYTGPGITSIDYGVGVAWVSLYGLKVYVMTHNNTMLNSLSNPWGVFTGNETFRLEKDYPSSKINLKINNVLKGSFTVPVFTDYIVNAALQVSGGTIIRPKFSFGCCTDCSSPQQYAELRNKLDGSYYDLRSNKLLFKLNGDYVANTIRFSVQDKFNNTVATHLSSGVINTATLNSGDNRYQLDFSSASYPPGYYVLKVTNEKNEQVFLRFKK